MMYPAKPISQIKENLNENVLSQFYMERPNQEDCINREFYIQFSILYSEGKIAGRGGFP